MKLFFALAAAALPLLAEASLEPSAGHHRPNLKARNFGEAFRPESRASHHPHHPHHRHRTRRSTAGAAIATSWDQVGDQVFDYVIAGGGTAGLALAGRLSEDEDVTVAVIEAGSGGYDDDEALLTPNSAYFKSSVGGHLDWQYSTVPQDKLLDDQGRAGRQAAWPRGKVLGGSSAINGLYYVAASKREHQVWGRLSGDLGSWGWHSFSEAMRKSQRYTKNSVGELREFVYDESEAMGASGPVCVSYPGVSYQPVKDWVPTLEAIGIEAAEAPYDGENQGAFVAASTIDPTSWQRSFSRTAYLDPVANTRKNIVVIPNQTVTRIVWSDESEVDAAVGRRALGLEFAASPDAERAIVTARREVILSAGAIGSPQILQLSGVGNPYLLAKHNITLIKDLPGVGQNLQDHLSASIAFKPAEGMKMPAAAAAAGSADAAKLNSFVDSSVAYVTLKKMYGDQEAGKFLERARRFSEDYIESATTTPEAVKRGWRKQYDYLLDDLLVEESRNSFTGGAKGAMEMLLGLHTGGVQVQTALQAPFSRGSIELAAADPFAKPHINPNYLQHRTDVELLRSGAQLARKVGETAPLRTLLSDEATAVSAFERDDEWDRWIAGTAGTEFHPSSTCSMLDEADGGVVDAELVVYGTQNVRVVDVSVVPLSLSSHLMSTAYAIAEVAADLIKNCSTEPVEECDFTDDDDDDDDTSTSKAER